MNNIIQKRVDCWTNTVSLCSSNPSLNHPIESLKIKYDNKYIYYRKYIKSNVKFFDMDTIDCCLSYSPNALVLNLADDDIPGGSVDYGSGAQEESLFRRTNYFCSLKEELYPIKHNEIVYSPGISVIKTSENTNWQLLDINNVPKVSFIACPGIKYPCPIIVDGNKQLNKKDTRILRNKIKTIIQTAIKYNHDTIIFGALGCGAWRNPITHVAQIFKEVLDKYDGVVLNYYFAIMSTPNDKIKTIDIFKNAFDAE